MLNDFYTLITSDDTVDDLIDGRLYPLRIPQDAALPALAYQLISAVPHYAHGEGDVGLRRDRVQITAQASDYAGIRALLDAVDAVVSGYRGVVGGTHFQAMFVANVRDDWGDRFERGVGQMDVIAWWRVDDD